MSKRDVPADETPEAEFEQVLIAVIREAPERWDREMLMRIASRISEGLRARGLAHTAFSDLEWWGSMLRRLRTDLEFLEWRCDPRQGVIPAECLPHLREAHEEAAAAAIGALIGALLQERRTTTAPSRAERGRQQAEQRIALHHRIRTEYSKLASNLSQRSRCEVLHKRHGWSRTTIIKALAVAD